MNQFDLYVNNDPDSNNEYPYIVDVQTALIERLNSRVVIPLTEAKPEQVLPNNLCPKIKIGQQSYYLLTYQITTVSKAFLKEKAGTLALNRSDIMNALDFLFTGI